MNRYMGHDGEMFQITVSVPKELVWATSQRVVELLFAFLQVSRCPAI